MPPALTLKSLNVTFPSNKQPAAFWVIAATVALSVFLLFFVDRYACNLIYHDQWDLYNPMFAKAGIAEAFLYQHGPHRQGLGGIATYILAMETGFSTVAESYMIAGVLIAAAFATLALKQKLGYKLVYADIALSLIVLNPVQFETITSVPNVSHSILPLLLLITLAITWISENRWIKYVASSIIAGFALFTGFGIFIWIAFFGFLAAITIEAAIKRNRAPAYPNLIGLGIMLLFAASFAVNYHSNAAQNSTSAIHEPVSDYLVFTNYLFGRIFYLPKSIRPYIGFLALVAVSMFTFHVLRARIRDQGAKKLHEICILFFSTSFLYIAGTAVGRIDLGGTGGGSSRYMSLTLPCFVAIYLILASRPSNSIGKQKHIYTVFVVLSFLSYFSNSFYAYDISESKTQKKRDWIEAYHETENLNQAELKSGFAVYPDNSKIQAKVDYLQTNRLNFFGDGE